MSHTYDRFAYDRFAQEFHNHFTSDPNRCVHLGVEKNLNSLPNPCMDYIQEETHAATRLLGEVKRVDRNDLSFDENLDLDLADLMLRQQIHNSTYTFNHKTQSPQLPQAGDEISSGIFLMFINDPRSAEERLENILHRIEEVPTYLERLKERLQVPVERWVQIDKEKVQKLPQFFSTLCSWARKENWANAKQLEAAVQKANEHCMAYVDTLKSLKTTDSFHVGKETAQEIVRLRGIDLEFNEMHELACEFIRETNLTIEALREKLCQKHTLPVSTTVQDLQAFLNEKFRIPARNSLEEDILRRYEQERTKILEFNKRKKLFPIIDSQDIQIMNTPDFMRPSIPAGAMVSPPPFREGIRKSLVYLTLSEELRDEHTDLSIPTMMIHEGIPGHHLQFATASMHPSIIRRHLSAMDQAEGWTTMLEDYMLDQNYVSEHTDETRFCAKRDICRIGARVAIDLFFMSGDRSYLDIGVAWDGVSPDPFVCAGSLLEKVTGFAPARVQAELNWYSQERGYPLSYLTGNHLVWTLKKDFEASTGQTLDRTAKDQQFHRIFLEAGNMPVRFLRRVFFQTDLQRGSA